LATRRTSHHDDIYTCCCRMGCRLLGQIVDPHRRNTPLTDSQRGVYAFGHDSSHCTRHAGVTNYATESESLQLTRCSKVRLSIAAFRTIEEDFLVCTFQLALYFGRSWRVCPRACPRACPSGCFGEPYGEETDCSPWQIDIYSRRIRWFFSGGSFGNLGRRLTVSV
jgi:hypothetical protein